MVGPQRWLIAGNALFAAVPVCLWWVPLEARFLPLIWALASITFSQMLSLGFWAGISSTPARRRFAYSFLGCVYLAIWPALVAPRLQLVDGPVPPLRDFVREGALLAVGLYVSVLVYAPFL